jgi:hypothetical protein
MELLVCCRLLLRRDIEHVRPGRDSGHSTPSSVPTARSTAMGEGSICVDRTPPAIGAPEIRMGSDKHYPEEAPVLCR